VALITYFQKIGYKLVDEFNVIKTHCLDRLKKNTKIFMTASVATENFNKAT